MLFPGPTYGDVTFPAGNYKTLRIELGDAAGHNWWCVLYPNLCFLDTTNAVLPEKGKQQLKKVLTEEEYSEVTAGSKFQIRWFFLEGKINMTEFLIRHFVKDYEEVEKVSVRRHMVCCPALWASFVM